MDKTNHIGDKIAVSISFLCAIHCFAFPILLTILPSLQFLNCNDVHFWTLVVVIPTSLLSLTLGCSKHKNKTYLSIALVGLAILSYAALWGHQTFGCQNEKYVTLFGSCILSFAHIRNYLHCRKTDKKTFSLQSHSDCCNPSHTY